MISFDTPSGRFSFRTAGIAIENGRVLLHRDRHEDFWVLPGGRVEQGETAAEALAREIDEEIGQRPEILRPLWIVESFFTYTGIPHHEIALYFQMRLPGPSPDAFTGLEGADHLEFRWIPLAGVAALPAQPRALIDRLDSLPPALEHLVLGADSRPIERRYTETI